MWSDFLRTAIHERFECLETVFPEFIIILVAVLYDERHHPFYLLSESVSSLATVDVIKNINKNIIVTNKLCNIVSITRVEKKSY